MPWKAINNPPPLPTWSVTFEATDSHTGDTEILTTQVKALNATSARHCFSTRDALHWSPDTDTVNTHGGFGPSGRVFGTWRITAVRKAQPRVLFIDADGVASRPVMSSLQVVDRSGNNLVFDSEAAALATVRGIALNVTGPARDPGSAGDAGWALWSSGMGDVLAREVVRVSAQRKVS
jgi:hypothetical protein